MAVLEWFYALAQQRCATQARREQHGVASSRACVLPQLIVSIMSLALIQELDVQEHTYGP